MTEIRIQVRTANYVLQWNLSIEDTSGTQLAVLYTVEPLYRGHHRDLAGCPVHYREVSLIVSLSLIQR